MMNAPDREKSLTLELLQEIDRKSDVTQRHLADRLGVALGLANAYLKRCVRKGLVKVKQAPANRYLYYLTPEGFSEKSKLTAEYLRRSFDFYRQASTSVTKVLDQCEAHGWRRLCLAGASELAEITLVRAREHDLTVVAIFDPQHGGRKFLGVPVLRQAGAGPDAWIVTAITDPQSIYVQLTAAVDAGRVLVPDLLDVQAEQVQAG